VAVWAWAFWKVNVRKDAQLGELFDKVAEMGRAQTEAVAKVEGSARRMRGPGPRGASGFYAGYFRDLAGNNLNVFISG
jgi:hypothetical protein